MWIFKSDDPEAMEAELAGMSPEYTSGMLAALDRSIELLNHYYTTGEPPPDDEPDAEQLDADGLNASERRACQALKVSAADFLAVKASFTGQKR